MGSSLEVGRLGIHSYKTTEIHAETQIGLDLGRKLVNLACISKGFQSAVLGLVVQHGCAPMLQTNGRKAMERADNGHILCCLCRDGGGGDNMGERKDAVGESNLVARFVSWASPPTLSHPLPPPPETTWRSRESGLVLLFPTRSDDSLFPCLFGMFLPHPGRAIRHASCHKCTADGCHAADQDDDLFSFSSFRLVSQPPPGRYSPVGTLQFVAVGILLPVKEGGTYIHLGWQEKRRF